MTIEMRISQVEERLRELSDRVEQLTKPKDWRGCVGMFTDDEIMQRIDEAARQYRRVDREKSKKRSQTQGVRSKS